MKQSLSRFLAIALAAALVLTCAISGLILPASAEGETNTTETNLLAGQVQELYTVNAGETAQTISATVSLTAETRYALRITTKSADATTTVSATGGVTLNVPQTANYRASQVLFVPESDVSEFVITLNAPATGSTDFTDIQLLKAPMDGTFNLIPASDFDVESAFFANRYAVNAYNTTDGDNNVLYSPTNSGSSVEKNINIRDIIGQKYEWETYPIIIKLSFRYKGTFCFTHGQSSSVEWLANNPDVTGNKYANRYEFSSPDKWTTASFYFKLLSFNGLYYLRIRNYTQDASAKDVWFDDFEMYEVAEASALTMSQATLELYKGNDAQLSAIVSPTNAYMPNAITWSSSADNIATVDQNGKVTGVAAGSATIKATLSETVFAECVVTVTEPGVNKEMYFANNKVTLTAANGTTDIENQLQFAEGFTAGELTWSITGTDATSTDGNSTYTILSHDGSKVTITGANTTSVENSFVFANLKPVITVTDNNTGSVATAPVEWEWPTTAFHVDFDNTKTGNTTLDGKIVTDTDGNALMYIKDGGDLWNTIYSHVYWKPNSTYRFSFRSKAVEGNTAKYQIRFNDQQDITLSIGTTLQQSGSTTEWMYNYVYINTGDEPTTSYDTLLINRYNTGDNPADVWIDDIKIELTDENEPILSGGDFETVTHPFYSNIIAKGHGSIVSGSTIGAEGNVLQLNDGLADADNAAIVGWHLLKPYHSYKVTFKKYGGKLEFNNSGIEGTYAQNYIVARDGVRSYAASDSWQEYTFTFATGNTVTSTGNWSSFFEFRTTGVVYLDDFAVTEIDAAYVYNKGARNGTVKILDDAGTEYSMYEAKAGDTVRVKVEANDGYLPTGALMQYYDEDGKLHSIFNTGLTMMKNSEGNVFTFTMPEGSAGVTIEPFVSAADTSYQWDTQASAVYWEDNEVTRLRFLNRLYIDDFDLASAETIQIKINGETYTVTEIGAIARVAADTELTIGTSGVYSGVCYSNTDSTIRVTDYTKRYFDFTVYVPISETNIDTQYDCIGYMKLENGDVLYTSMWTTSAADTRDRELAVLQ